MGEARTKAGRLAVTSLGDRLATLPLVRRIGALPEAWRAAGATALLSALIFVPYVGAVGLWDPWETHYGEVAREMIDRSDYVYPYWQDSWFFSKPPLTMWIDVLGMQLVGTNRGGEGRLPLYTEWGMRLPFALLSVAALAVLAWALTRIVNRRVGLTAAFVLATMPLYFLITRQAVTDTPFVVALVAAMACALVGLFDGGTRRRAAWWYAFYILLGLGTLAKGLLGVGLPAVILLLYAAFFVFPWNHEGIAAHGRWLLSAEERSAVRAGNKPMPPLFAEMARMHLLSGMVVFFAVAAPWYVTLSLFPEVDSENKTFFVRFFIHDHLERLFTGVHTTTPGGSFTYFIEQGGYAIFPWVALVPGALAVAARIRFGAQDVRARVAFIALLWAIAAFTLMEGSMTKFHHYVLPVLPGVAILIALFVDEVWEEGIAAHGVSLLIGLALFALVAKDLAGNLKNFTDLFVYNYERPYPFELDTRPIRFGEHVLTLGDLVAAVLLGAAAYFLFGATEEGESRGSARLSAAVLAAGGLTPLLASALRTASPMLLLAILLAGAAGYALWSATRERGDDRRAAMHSVWWLGAVAVLLLVAGARVGPADPLGVLLRQPMNVKAVLGSTFFLAGGVCTVAALARARPVLFSAFGALALGFALWFSWSHWVDLSHHWTQRDLFWRYYDRRRPSEPITAYMMDWKGETLYSKNTVRQIKDSAPRLGLYAQLPGRKWALVEQARLGLLRQAVGADHVVTPVDRDLNVKFVLVTIE